MSDDRAIEKIAAAVLYEGYLLWPYRRSATKNQQRWTLGGVYPRAYSEASGGTDRWFLQTQCLVAGEAPSVGVTVRFLHVVERRVQRRESDGSYTDVDELNVEGSQYLAWEEATERTVSIDALEITSRGCSRRVEFSVPAASEVESLCSPEGEEVGRLVRRWAELRGDVEVSAEPIGRELFRLTVRVMNTAPEVALDRRGALRRTFVSTHAVLSAQGGEFISMTDAPVSLQSEVSGCQNLGMWPVLAGEEGDRSTMLSAPIVLYDYPQIAPESPGDLFDGTEIDQLLVLNILTLTDDEKEEMRATDPRAREILARTEGLGTADFMLLNGAIREFRMLQSPPEEDPFGILERPAPEWVTVEGVTVTKGSRVRLRPRNGRDLMDLALAGKMARVEGIEQDYEERVHLVVSVEDDPGQDLGDAAVLGHRFFFAPEELEPVSEATPR